MDTTQHALDDADVDRMMTGADISECFQWLQDAGLRIGPGEYWPWVSQDGATRGAAWSIWPSRSAPGGRL